MLERHIGCTLAAVIVATLTSLASAAVPPLVQIRSGPIRGSGTDVMAFKNIPYAAPPTGELRWRAPAPALRWSSVRDATQFGEQCVQAVGLVPGGARDAAGRSRVVGSEDCLTLNVWTPARSAREKLPVMVWLHGGGFLLGSGSGPRSDGTNLARRGVVVVTLNYRLLALGFLAHPALSRESPQGVSGNYGLMDQIAALRWVRDNIGRFGGDPRNVTLFGQSAGATSIACLLVSPLARGLFHRAIAHSLGASFAGPRQYLRKPSQGMAAAETQGTAAGMDIEAMRKLDAAAVIERLPSAPTNSAGTHFYPIIDGYVVPDDPVVLLSRRHEGAIPLLMGHNADEGLFWLRDAPKSVSAYRELIAGLFPGVDPERILARYPAGIDADAPAAELRMFGELRVSGVAVLTARAASAANTVYLYRFTRVAPSSRTTFGGAAHGTELAYVFDHVTDDARQFDPWDRELSSAMAGAWVQFARTGDPNGAGLPQWPKYLAPNYQLLEFGDEIAVRTNASDAQVDFARDLYESMGNSPEKNDTPEK